MRQQCIISATATATVLVYNDGGTGIVVLFLLLSSKISVDSLIIIHVGFQVWKEVRDLVETAEPDYPVSLLIQIIIVSAGPVFRIDFFVSEMPR